MELRQLEHFIAVAEESSFTRAAQRLHLVQSTLSVSIRGLERELGGRLFERTTHQVRLTDAGRALLTEARTTLAAADAARDAVADVLGGVRGTVHVGIMHSLRLFDLAAVLTRYHAMHPRVQIVPHTALGGSAELVAGVLDGELDLAFTALPGRYPHGLAVTPLAAEPLRLACPEGHPLAERERIELAELDGERFVDFPAGWGTRASVDRIFEREGLQREIAVEVTDIPTAVELVRAGFGLAFLGESLTVGARPVPLRPIHPEPMFEVSLVIPTGRRMSAAARAFVEPLRNPAPLSGAAAPGTSQRRPTAPSSE
jgi:DNA-binding transcriptional LysR family regulator